MTTDLNEKLDRLTTILAGLAINGRFAIAYSGGLDSRFLAHAANLANLEPELLHAHGPHIASGENRYARDWAIKNRMQLHILQADPLTVPEVAANDRMRCYHCKKALFSRLLAEAKGLPLCDGTQASDSGTYRPGRAALQELGIRSPLAEAGLAKSEIRLLAAKTGMDNPGQKARPCLLTRFAYDLPPNRPALAALDKAEQRIESALHRFYPCSIDAELPDFRLRHLAGGEMELHLTPMPGTCETLPDNLEASLRQAVRGATGKEPSAIREMPQLSGFFDKD